AAGRSVARRGAPDRRHRAVESRLSRPRHRRLRVLVPAALAAARRAARHPSWHGRLHRPRTDGALVPDDGGRYSGRRAARAEIHLPHVQRLHHRTAAGVHVRLLSARPVLRRAPGGRDDSEGAHAGAPEMRSDMTITFTRRALLLAAILVAAATAGSAQQAKPALGGYIIEHDADVATNE